MFIQKRITTEKHYVWENAQPQNWKVKILIFFGWLTLLITLHDYLCDAHNRATILFCIFNEYKCKSKGRKKYLYAPNKNISHAGYHLKILLLSKLSLKLISNFLSLADNSMKRNNKCLCCVWGVGVVVASRFWCHATLLENALNNFLFYQRTELMNFLFSLSLLQELVNQAKVQSLNKWSKYILIFIFNILL